MKTLVIRNGRVLLPDGRLESVDVLIENGRIAAIDKNMRHAATVLDAAGGYVLPGLIDLHVHGICNDSTETTLAEFATQEARYGATAFMPTFFGPPEYSADDDPASSRNG